MSLYMQKSGNIGLNLEILKLWNVWKQEIVCCAITATSYTFVFLSFKMFVTLKPHEAEQQELSAQV